MPRETSDSHRIRRPFEPCGQARAGRHRRRVRRVGRSPAAIRRAPWHGRQGEGGTLARHARARDVGAADRSQPADSAGDHLGDEAQLRRLAAQERALPHRLSGEPPRRGVEAREGAGPRRPAVVAEHDRVRRGGAGAQARSQGRAAGAALWAWRLFRAAHRPHAGDQARGQGLSRLPPEPGRARCRAPVPGLCQERALHRDGAGGGERVPDALSPALLALHHAAAGQAEAGARRRRAGCCWGRSCTRTDAHAVHPSLPSPRA